MTIIKTENGFPQKGEPAYHVYNGLDSCLTFEIFEKIHPQLDPTTAKVYQTAKDDMGFAMEMMIRGIKIDVFRRNELISTYMAKKNRLEYILNKYTGSLFGEHVNAASPMQKQRLLYTLLKLPIKRNFKKKSAGGSTDREALEKLAVYWTARPFVQVLLGLADVNKTLGTLRTKLDQDNRIRAGFDVVGTDTGRMASRASCFHTGTNLQNITSKLRRMFIADPAKRMSYVDLEQAESRAVGIIIWKLFGDPSYIDACESSDLHTLVCKMVWTDLIAKTELRKGSLIIPAGTPFGDDPAVNKIIAGQHFYRDMTYRDMAKRGGHGTNYYGKPPQMAMHLKVETKLIENFQKNYFKAFPGIPRWHKWVAQQLQTKGSITTFMGRRRIFFDRQTEDSTLRSAIAFEPQSAVAAIEAQGLRQVRQKLSSSVTIHAQVHDAGLFQYAEKDENTIIPLILKTMEVPLTIAGRPFLIPNEAQVGWNWEYYASDNLNGLKDFTGNDTRTRINEQDLLHRTFR